MYTVVGRGAATYSDDSAPSLVAREISDSKAASVAAPAALPFPHTMQVWGYIVWGCRTLAVMRYLKGFDLASIRPRASPIYTGVRSLARRHNSLRFLLGRALAHEGGVEEPLALSWHTLPQL